MGLTGANWRPITAHEDFYDKLCSKEINFVGGKLYLFGIAIALGFILGKRSTQISTMENGMFYPFQSYQDTEKYPVFLELLDYVFDYYAEGTNERAKHKDIEKIADGGIEFLMEEFDKQPDKKSVDLSSVILDIKQILEK